MPEQEWSVVFYHEGGTSPVREFIESLDKKTQARFAWSIEQLRFRNLSARHPLVDHISGKIWELREESRTNIYRVLYFVANGRRIVLVHGFQRRPKRRRSARSRRLNEG